MAENYSMTGFARGEAEVYGSRLRVEVRSLNHRYLDLKLSLSRELLVFEERIAGLCRSFFQRGRIEVWADLAPGERLVEVRWNRPLAAGLLNAWREMKTELGVAGEPELSLFAHEKDVIMIVDSGAFSEEHWPAVFTVFSECFQALNRMRAREGEVLVRDIQERTGRIGEWVKEIKAMAGEVLKTHEERLVKKLGELSASGLAIDQVRLSQELVLFADRVDITEELVRLESHLEQFREVINTGTAKGRKLDFLLQEMFREINTASNKAQHVGVSRRAVEVKVELEKIREQVQNLE